MPMLPIRLLLLATPQTVAPTPAKDQPVTASVDPQDVKVVYTLHAKGDQIYLCSAQKDGMKWVLGEPAATLYDASDKAVAKHGYGPRWTWSDGSALIGKVVGKKNAPDSANIPWLLVKTDPFTGPNNGEFDPAGKLDAITYVKRSDTQGGLAPTSGCEAKNIGESKPVPYTATYTFYAPAP